MLPSNICESLRSLAHPNCVNVFALTRLLFCALCLSSRDPLRSSWRGRKSSGSVLKRCVKTGKHVIKHTSNTNIRAPRLCVSFNVDFLLSPCLEHGFCSFRSLFESFSIDYKTQELKCFVFETFYLLPFLASTSRPQGPFDFTLPERCIFFFFNKLATIYNKFISVIKTKK